MTTYSTATTDVPFNHLHQYGSLERVPSYNDTSDTTLVKTNKRNPSWQIFSSSKNTSNKSVMTKQFRNSHTTALCPETENSDNHHQRICPWDLQRISFCGQRLPSKNNIFGSDKTSKKISILPLNHHHENDDESDNSGSSYRNVLVANFFIVLIVLGLLVNVIYLNIKLAQHAAE